MYKMLSCVDLIEFISDFVMIAVILVSHRLRLNPDNVATPLAASVGDVVSITVLANVASLLYSHHGKTIFLLRQCSMF
jgi:cation transporter-like permease